MSGNLTTVTGAINPMEAEEQRSGVQLLIDGPTSFVVKQAMLVDSKSQKGYKNLAMIYESTDPENPGEMREWLVISHPNEDAQVIGRNKLSWLAQSAGITEELNDTAQVEGKHVFLDVRTAPRSDKPQFNTNLVGRYIPATEWRESTPTRTATAPAPSRNEIPAPAAAAGTSPAPAGTNAPQGNPWVGER